MKHYINNTQITPRNIYDIGISVDFSKNIEQELINVDTLILPNEGKQIVMNHLQSLGQSEGIPYTLDVNGKQLQYYVDLSEALKIRSNEVEVKIKERYAHDNFFENAQALTFELLATKRTIATREVSYTIIPQDPYTRAIVISVTLFTIFRAIADQAREIATTAKEFASAFAFAPFAVQGKALEAGLKLAIQIAYIAVLIYQAKKLIQDLAEIIYPKIRYLNCATILELLTQGCEELGYTFKSTIIQGTYKNLALIPIPQNRNKKKFTDYFLNDLDFAFNKGYPTAQDSTPTLGTLLEAMSTMFNAKIKVRNKIVELERWDYWKNKSNKSISTGLILQSEAMDEFELDNSRMFKRYLLQYQTDQSDWTTLDTFDTNNTEYSIERAKVVNQDLNLIKGLTSAEIPFSRAKSKTKLTWIEKQVQEMFKLIDSIAGTSYGTKLNKLGVIEVTNQYFGMTKLIMHDGGTKQSQSDIIDPNTLWNNFHYINNPDLYQWIIRRNAKTPMTIEEFEVLLDNNFATINGKDAEILNMEYLPMQNTAIMTYRTQENIFANNTNLIKIY
jgi:hypothetical protein